jgi:hypothetical protein
MSQVYSYAFYKFEMAVRCGECLNDNLHTISYYVYLGIERAKGYTQLTHTSSAYLRVVDTLVETMCDPLLPIVWRHQCYTYIKRMMPLLYEILAAQAYQQKIAEITTYFDFFLNHNARQPTLKKGVSPSQKKP